MSPFLRPIRPVAKGDRREPARTDDGARGGVFTGVVRGPGRYGVRFVEAIGYRLAPDGTKTALHYGELKLSADGFYHLIPRTGPSVP